MQDATEHGQLGPENDRAAENGVQHLMTSDSQAVHEFADSMAHIAWTAGPDGSVLWFNRRFYDYTGLPEGAAVGWDWSIVIHPDDLQMLVDDVIRALQSGEDLRCEARGKRHDGEMRWLLIQAVPVRNQEGDILRWLGTATDIHDRIQAEEALRRSEERLRAIIDGAEEFAIILMDPDLSITEWNLGAENVFGWTREEAVGQSGRIIFTPEDVKTGVPEAESTIAEREGRSADERWHIRKDSSRLWGSGIMTVLCNEDKTVKGFVKVLRDVTDRRQMEQELEKRVKARTSELEAANKEMEGFTYSVSHDLRAPLRAIVSTSHILLEESAEKLNPEERNLLKRQGENANKMAILIDDLLRLSRIGRQEMAVTQFDFSELAQSVAQEFERPSNISVEVQPGLIAIGDTKLIRLALENLIDNACKFSPDGGTIAVGSRETPNGTALFVADQGIGFDPRYEPKIFLPFERLHGDSDFPGTGIGLANVKRVVERHGGKIWAESAGAGEGATFYFTLPAQPA